MPNGYFGKRSKTEKKNITIENYIFKLFWVTDVNLSKQFWFFETNLPKKGVSLKNKHRHWVLYIWVKLCIKFNVKQFLSFGPNLPKNGVSSLKQMERTSPLSSAYSKILKKNLENFSLSKQFWIFGPNIPKKGIYDQTLNKWTFSLNSAY